MNETVFQIPKMDCPSEEGLVRMALSKGKKIAGVNVNLDTREVTVAHDTDPETVLSLLAPLGMGAKIARNQVVQSPTLGSPAPSEHSDASERRVLKQLLAINAAMFAIEIVLGWLAQSAGLIADSLDMFSDAAVYGMSLYAVGRAAHLKNRAARISGYVQMLLALGAFSEVIRRFVYGSEPVGTLMMGIAILALVANVTCMALLAKHRTGGVHMKASWIFSTNDVIANIGVIVAGVLVTMTGSSIPDLVVGSVISIVVLSGAIRILKVSRAV